MILAGDIGGTKTNLAVFDADSEQLAMMAEKKFDSQAYVRLEEIVSAFLEMHKLPVDQACFGIAGPVKEERCVATNLPWEIDARDLEQQFGFKSVKLLNDLEANAYGIAVLAADDFMILNQGIRNPIGNAAIIAAGTGLGEAGFYWNGRQHHPFACEGGHTDFAPRNELEAELLRFLLKRHKSVSYERVLSGPGLYTIYQFLRDTKRGDEPDWLAEELQYKDPSAVISQAALEKRVDLCTRTLELFVSLYGAETGNLALKIMATGGMYIGGGIAPKIIPKLRDGTFMRAFTAKGRMKPLLEAIPVRVILNDQTALLGAAHYVRLQAYSTSLILTSE